MTNPRLANGKSEIPFLIPDSARESPAKGNTLPAHPGRTSGSLGNPGAPVSAPVYSPPSER
jgi:hypothetical protein